MAWWKWIHPDYLQYKVTGDVTVIAIEQDGLEVFDPADLDIAQPPTPPLVFLPAAEREEDAAAVAIQDRALVDANEHTFAFDPARVGPRSDREDPATEITVATDSAAIAAASEAPAKQLTDALDGVRRVLDAHKSQMYVAEMAVHAAPILDSLAAAPESAVRPATEAMTGIGDGLNESYRAFTEALTHAKKVVIAKNQYPDADILSHTDTSAIDASVTVAGERLDEAGGKLDHALEWQVPADKAEAWKTSPAQMSAAVGAGLNTAAAAASGTAETQQGAASAPSGSRSGGGGGGGGSRIPSSSSSRRRSGSESDDDRGSRRDEGREGSGRRGKGDDRVTADEIMTSLASAASPEIAGAGVGSPGHPNPQTGNQTSPLDPSNPASMFNPANPSSMFNPSNPNGIIGSLRNQFDQMQRGLGLGSGQSPFGAGQSPFGAGQSMRGGMGASGLTSPQPPRNPLGDKLDALADMRKRSGLGGAVPSKDASPAKPGEGLRGDHGEGPKKDTAPAKPEPAKSDPDKPEDAKPGQDPKPDDAKAAPKPDGAGAGPIKAPTAHGGGGDDTSDPDADAPEEAKGDTPAGDDHHDGGPKPGETTIRRGSETFDLGSQKAAKMADLLNPADGSAPKTLRDAAAEAGFAVGEPGAPVGTSVSPTDLKAGDVVIGNGDEGIYAGNGKVLTSSGIRQLESMSDFSDDSDGLFRLTEDAGGEAPGTADAPDAPEAPHTPQPADSPTNPAPASGSPVDAGFDSSGKPVDTLGITGDPSLDPVDAGGEDHHAGAMPMSPKAPAGSGSGSGSSPTSGHGTARPTMPPSGSGSGSSPSMPPVSSVPLGD